jgi:hypothetical protein
MPCQVKLRKAFVILRLKLTSAKVSTNTQVYILRSHHYMTRIVTRIGMACDDTLSVAKLRQW